MAQQKVQPDEIYDHKLHNEKSFKILPGTFVFECEGDAIDSIRMCDD